MNYFLLCFKSFLTSKLDSTWNQSLLIWPQPSINTPCQNWFPISDTRLKCGHQSRRITWSRVFLWKITHLRHDLSQMTLNTGDQVQRCFWLNFVTPPSPAPHPHFPFFVENISKKFMFSHYMCVLYFVFCILCVFIFTTPLSSLTLLHQHQQRICHKTVPCTCCLL